MECQRRTIESGLLLRGANGQPKPNPLLAILHRTEARGLVEARAFERTPRSASRMSLRPSDV